MKIVLAFDSFKGSLTAEEAVEAAQEAIKRTMPDAEVVTLPLADGGEGTTQALARNYDATWRHCCVHDALMRPIKASYAVCNDSKTAIMEMAAAAGLTLLTPAERDPMRTSTYGVGEMMLDAITHGCTHILIGIGGSATNDGGMGMLAALGARFWDDKGEELTPSGENLAKIADIDWNSMTDMQKICIEVICDVENPLFGPNGAAHVYAPQKGADKEAVQKLDNGLKNLANRCSACFDHNPSIPGCGAAGGLGYALLLLNGRLRRGIDVILDASKIDYHLRQADLCITGEGKIDRQTLNGKLPFGVLQRAKKHGVPVIALAGKIEDKEALISAGFAAVESINPPETNEKNAMQRETARKNLMQTIIDIKKRRTALEIASRTALNR